MIPTFAQPTVAQAIVAIDDLNQQDLNASEYFSKLLSIVIAMQDATAGSILQIRGESVEPMVQALGENKAQFAYQSQEICKQILASGRPAYLNSSDPLQPSILLGALLANEEDVIGVLIVECWPSDPSEIDDRLQAIEYAASRVQQAYIIRNNSFAAAQLAKLEKARTVVDGVSKYVDPELQSHEVVNRIQHYLGVDRVTLAFRYGKRCLVKGISNQAVFDRRSNVVRSLEQLGAKVSLMSEALWYPSASEDLPPSLTTKIDRFLASAHSQSLAILPLMAEKKRRDDPENIASTIQSDQDRLECIGVLVLEGIETPLRRERIIRRWERIQTPVSNSIANARRLDSLFLMPLWRRLGIVADWYRGHTQRKALLITLAIVAVITSLFCIPADFKLRGDGAINPRSIRHVFAETEGTVKVVNFNDGQFVEAGASLLTLQNPQLAAQIAETEGRLHEAEEELKTITVQRIARTFETLEEKRELVRRASSAQTRIEGLTKEISVLQQSRAQLQIDSPMAGNIVTWDSQQRLQNRPVKRGDRLMTIAEPDEGWELNLRIPDKRAGYLLSRWDESIANKETMKVSFVLTSNPTNVLWGSVVEISPLSNTDDSDKENVVRVRVNLSPEELAKIEEPKPGTTVIGHVHCGQSSLAYAKLYEFIDWAKTMWFRFVA